MEVRALEKSKAKAGKGFLLYRLAARREGRGFYNEHGIT
jgi:hypothetical protein